MALQRSLSAVANDHFAFVSAQEAFEEEAVDSRRLDAVEAATWKASERDGGFMASLPGRASLPRRSRQLSLFPSVVKSARMAGVREPLSWTTTTTSSHHLPLGKEAARRETRWTMRC